MTGPHLTMPKVIFQVLAVVLLTSAVLASLRLAPGGSAAQQTYFTYLPWLEQSSPLHINVFPFGGPPGLFFLRMVPQEAIIGPGRPVVWTVGHGFSDSAIFEFRGFWNGDPSASWRLSLGQSFQAVFSSPGTFTYTVNPVSGGSPVGEGAIRVVEDPPLTIANLWVSMRPNQTGVTVGDGFAYDIFLDNVGLTDIPLTLTDTIPSQVSFLSVSCIPLEGPSCPGPVYSPTLNSILWTGTAKPTRNPDTGELTGNPSQHFRLGVKVESASGPFTNTVVVSSGPITMTASARVVAEAPVPTPTPTPTATPTPPVPTPTAVIIP